MKKVNFHVTLSEANCELESLVKEKFGIPSLEYETEMTENEAFDFVLGSMKVSDWFKEELNVLVRLCADVRTEKTAYCMQGSWCDNGNFKVDVKPMYEERFNIFNDSDGMPVEYKKYDGVDMAVITYMGLCIEDCPASIADVDMSNVLKAISAYHNLIDDYYEVVFKYDELEEKVGGEEEYGINEICRLCTIRNHIVSTEYAEIHWFVHEINNGDEWLEVEVGFNMKMYINESHVVQISLRLKDGTWSCVDEFNCNSVDEIVDLLVNTI